MKNIIILGIGNRLMMDDGIGVYIVEKLRDMNINEKIKLIAGETDIGYCLDEAFGADFIIIIDAIKMGGNPGEMRQIPLEDIETIIDNSQHNLSIINCIRLFYKKLNGLVIGIEPFEIRYNLGISDHLNEKVQGIINNIESTIFNKSLEI